MHINSILADRAEAPTLAERQQAIHRNLLIYGAATDRQIAQRMGFLDLNCVRPRVTELIQLGMASEMGVKRCDVTGRTVRVVRGVREGGQ